MNVNTLESPQSPQTWQHDDEIDLRQYLEILVHWRREIALITIGSVVLASIVVVLLRMVEAPVYVASADVAIARMASDVSFDERFITSADQVGTDVASAGARRSALLGLVASGGVALDVINELGDLLSAEERSPAALLERVDAEAGPAIGNRVDSDLIRITVSASSPEKAAAIANAWAQAYVRRVNEIYGQVPDEVLASIQEEQDKARQAYLESQAQIEAFIANNRIDELTSLSTVLQQQINQEVTMIQSLLSNWQRSNEQLNAVRALRTQIAAGGVAAARSNMVALQSLKLTVFGMPTSDLQVELRDLPEVTPEAMLVDVDALIVALEERLRNVENEIAARNNQLRFPAETLQATDTITTPLLSATYEELRQVKAEIEAQTARRTQLEQQRNLSWETYKTLNNKVAELTLTRAAAGSEVRFAAPAVEPMEPVKGIRLSLVTALAGFAGLFLSLVTVLISNALGQQPFLSRKAVY